MKERNALIKAIVGKEWQMFDKVNNAGGRAECQDNWSTFSIMRTSQLDAWADDTLRSYRDDLDKAAFVGRNLLQEKYAYMMRRTAPQEYAKIEWFLPAISREKQALVDELTEVQVAEMERAACRYPHVATTMRPLRRANDSLYCTSFETYLWGELLSYSLETLQCYRRQLMADPAAYGLAVLTETAVQYGCKDLDELEAVLANHADLVQLLNTVKLEPDEVM
ncbi:MAG: DUF4125 family protein [Faecalibacterium sp.]|nr:DUF4125 family protein [Faecalibacterium sp.]